MFDVFFRRPLRYCAAYPFTRLSRILNTLRGLAILTSPSSSRPSEKRSGTLSLSKAKSRRVSAFGRAPSRRSQTARCRPDARARRCAGRRTSIRYGRGSVLSQSLSMSPITWRCRFGCEPQRLHGIMGELLDFGVADQVFFFHIGQRADHDMLAVVGNEFRGHGFEFSAVKHV